MDRLVPLVVYKNGVREILGTAEIKDDGRGITIHCTIDDADSARKLLPDIGEFSVSWIGSRHCLACQTNQCGKGKDDKNCLCCQTGHI